MGVKRVPYLRRPANTRREGQQDTVLEFPREHVIFVARFHLLPQPGDPRITVHIQQGPKYSGQDPDIHGRMLFPAPDISQQSSRTRTRQDTFFANNLHGSVAQSEWSHPIQNGGARGSSLVVRSYKRKMSKRDRGLHPRWNVLFRSVSAPQVQTFWYVWLSNTVALAWRNSGPRWMQPSLNGHLHYWLLWLSHSPIAAL